MPHGILARNHQAYLRRDESFLSCFNIVGIRWLISAGLRELSLIRPGLTQVIGYHRVSHLPLQSLKKVLLFHLFTGILWLHLRNSLLHWPCALEIKGLSVKSDPASQTLRVREPGTILKAGELSILPSDSSEHLFRPLQAFHVHRLQEVVKREQLGVSPVC